MPSAWVTWKDCWKRRMRQICRGLEGGERTIGYLRKAVNPLFAPADCYPLAMVVYNVLHQLRRGGWLKIAVYHRPGVKEGLLSPQFKAYL